MTMMTRFLLEIWDEHGPMLVIGALVVGLLTLLVSGAVLSERQWKVHAAEHHCMAVGKKEGYWVGKYYAPPQTIYQCDGGEIVIR